MTKNNLSIIFEELFQVSLVGYLIFLLMETIKTGFVSNFFDLNILLGVVVLTSVGTAIFGKSKKEKKASLNKELDLYLVGAFSIVSGAIVYYKTREMGNVSIVVSVVAGILIFLLSYLTYSEKGKD